MTKRRVRKSKRSTSRRKSTNKRNNSRRNNSRRNNIRRKNIRRKSNKRKNTRRNNSRRKSTNKRQGKVIQDGGAYTKCQGGCDNNFYWDGKDTMFGGEEGWYESGQWRYKWIGEEGREQGQNLVNDEKSFLVSINPDETSVFSYLCPDCTKEKSTGVLTLLMDLFVKHMGEKNLSSNISRKESIDMRGYFDLNPGIIMGSDETKMRYYDNIVIRFTDDFPINAESLSECVFFNEERPLEPEGYLNNIRNHGKAKAIANSSKDTEDLTSTHGFFSDIRGIIDINGQLDNLKKFFKSQVDLFKITNIEEIGNLSKHHKSLLDQYLAIGPIGSEENPIFDNFINSISSAPDNVDYIETKLKTFIVKIKSGYFENGSLSESEKRQFNEEFEEIFRTEIAYISGMHEEIRRKEEERGHEDEKKYEQDERLERERHKEERIRRQKKDEEQIEKRKNAIKDLKTKKVVFAGNIEYTFDKKVDYKKMFEQLFNHTNNQANRKLYIRSLHIDVLAVYLSQKRLVEGRYVYYSIKKNKEILELLKETYIGDEGMNIGVFTNLLSELKVSKKKQRAEQKQEEEEKDLMPWINFSHKMPLAAPVWGGFTQESWDSNPLMDRKRWRYLIVVKWHEAEKKGVESKEIWWGMVNNEGSRSALELLGLVKGKEEDFVQRFRSVRVPDEYAYPKLYGILGVDAKDSRSVIKRAWVKLATEHHPDKGGDQEDWQNIQKAYDVLGDDDNRKLYDQGKWGEMWGGNRRVRKF